MKAESQKIAGLNYADKFWFEKSIMEVIPDIGTYFFCQGKRGLAPKEKFMTLL